MAARLTKGGREWFSVELKGNNIGRFREFCRDTHINFETSECEYGYTHFEVLVNSDEFDNANRFLETLD